MPIMPKNNALTRSKNGKLKMQIYWLIIFWDCKGHLKRSLYTMFIFEEKKKFDWNKQVVA